MFLLVQSAFLQALGLAIANSLWQMGMLWLLVQVAILFFRPSAAARYALSVSAALAGLLWFGISFLYHWQLAPASATPDSIWQTAGVPSFLLVVVAATRWLIPYLAVAYLLVIAILGLRLYNSFRQVNQLRSSGLSKAPVEWRLFVQQYGGLLHVGRQVRLYLSNQVSGPLTIGFWKPVILLPLATINQLSPQQMEAVLLHELVHIRRHDYLINIFLQAAEILLFFNPFMRSLLRQAGTERENSCDDLVLQFNYNPREYATALLTLEKQASSQALGLAAAGNDKDQFQLLHRIRRMVNPGKQPFNYRAQLGLLGLLMVIAILSQLLLQRNRLNTLTETVSPQVVQQGQIPVPRPSSAAFDLAATLAMLSEAAGRLQVQGSATPTPALPLTITADMAAPAVRPAESPGAPALATTESPVGINKHPIQDWESLFRTWATLTKGQEATLALSPAESSPIPAWPRQLPVSAKAGGLDAASFLIAQVLAEEALVLEHEKAALEEMARLYLHPDIIEALPARVLVLPPSPAEPPATGQEGNKSAPGTETMERQRMQYESEQSNHLSMEARRRFLAAEIAARAAAIQALEAEIAMMNRQAAAPGSTDSLRAPQAASPENGKKHKKPRVIIQL
ncbi:MAG: M56 family metallopeptidase [Chitinophagaceae bacterium]|nr:M56 family metallopeptidase [Chitinophagaceae bacterium]